MVVLAAAVCTKTGKALVSRQFVDISRVRIEGLLAAFPKLMGSGKQGAGTVQHTFIETDAVRYVYQPLEGLYMLLLTNKSSNILEDLETLHLLAKLVPEFCGRLDEEQVTDKAFELIFAFDEVIAVGYKEKVTLQQIKTFLEMDSQEEKIHDMLKENKEREAMEEAARKRQQIEKMRQESMKSGMGGGMGGGMAGMGSGRFQGSGSGSFETAQSPADPFVVRETRAPPKAAPSRQGMVLGQKEPTSKFLQAMTKEMGVDLVREEAAVAATPGIPAVPREKVNIEVIEMVSATVANDGGLQSPLDVRGDLTLTIDDPSAARVDIHIAPSADHKGFNFKAHPNINRDVWMKDRIIMPKGEKAFPTSTPLNVLKWRWQTTDESALPLTVSCWPTPGGDGTTAVTLEYELQRTSFVLSNVCISIPIIGAAPALGEIAGDYDFDVKNHILHWKLDLIDDSNPTGSAEFSMGAVDASSLFPISISYTSVNTFCPIEVEQVIAADEEVRYSLQKSLQTDQYQLLQ